MNPIKPDITVVVPTFNEEEELPGLLATLSAQENVLLELILCDGESNDCSHQIFLEQSAELSFHARWIQTVRGRGRQMNAGAAVATSGLLLFLHADSRFDECTAISKAVALHSRYMTSGSQLFAGRFGLKFRRRDQSPSLAYFYYEAKARLPRADCIRGDQGFLLDSRTFSMAGGFDESLPFLEDIRLVENTASLLEWQLLPATISTSARRFEQEGLLERQVLNAIIANNVVTGWTEFFHALPGIYHCHSETGRLLLTPLLQNISEQIARHNITWQNNFWQATGHHVAGNAWQLFFWLDVLRAFKSGKAASEMSPDYLDFYRRWLEQFFKSRLAAFLAQNSVKLWLRWMLFKGTSRTARPPAP